MHVIETPFTVEVYCETDVPHNELDELVERPSAVLYNEPDTQVALYV